MIYPTADVSPDARIGEGTRIWHEAQVREGASVGADCIIGKGVYIDRNVVIGGRCKIQNRASIYLGVTLEDGVYIGPHVSFANDKYPRAVNPDGSLKGDGDWEVLPTLVREGASIGAGAVVLPGVTIGRWAMVGAASVVTRDVPEQRLVVGNPALYVGYVCKCGRPLANDEGPGWSCSFCGLTYTFEAGE
jgi:acetyltransferase-like isoleucine patch superfamily enzyme